MTIQTKLFTDNQQRRPIGSSRVNSKAKGKAEYVLPTFNLQQLLTHIQNLVERAPNGVVQLIIDLFCGAGGTSEGIEQARWRNKKNSCIIAGINHDIKAIYSQAVNHPIGYYTSEDIRLANLEPIAELVRILRFRFPQCPIIIWASLECTNHSNAKGGQSRDEDSRTLAWDLNRYVKELNVDGIWIENVKEFEIWGPLTEKTEWIDRKGKKVKDSYPPVDPDPLVQDWKQQGYWNDKIKAGEIGTCELTYKYEGKGKKKQLIAIEPTWVTDWRFAGLYYRQWTREIDLMGFHHQSRVLNAADYGAPTNRYRFFLLFMRKGWPIQWPETTHSKEGGEGLFAKPKHIPVRTCLNFDVKGRSIFEDGHVESEKTWERIYEGLVKFVAGGKEAFKNRQSEYFITKYMGNSQKTGVNKGKSIDEPSVTITCQNRLALVEAEGVKSVKTWISKYYSSHNNTKQNAGQGIDQPCDTVTTRGAGAKMDAEQVDSKFLDIIYGKGFPSSLDAPAPTVRCKDGQALVEPEFFDVKYFISKAYKTASSTSIDEPCGAITTIPKSEVVQVDGWLGDDQYNKKGTSLDAPAPTVTASRHWHYLYNPGWFGHVSTVEAPSVCIVASQDKAPLSMATVEQSDVTMIIPVFESDSPMMVKVKEFMALYDIYDIKKRALMIPELLKIQSFPDDYYLAGSQTDQKKFIGNAVPPKVAKAIAESMYDRLVEFMTEKIAA